MASNDKAVQEGEAAVKPVIVGIGASAGGVQALQAFFEALPDQTGAAFIVVVHLDPKSHSDLSSILGARTRMRVIQVKETEKLDANSVYVIPPDRRLQITDHEVSAASFDEPRGRRAPIDLLFRSLAEQHGDGFAIILTGAGSDGAVGVRAVKEAGGLILVQDPNEAEYPSMPRSAIATGNADLILPIHELAARLVELLHNRDSIAIADTGELDEDVFRRILTQVLVRTGHDFSKYKRSTLLRRIGRRMQVARSENLRAYSDFLHHNRAEPDALLRDLLISVTTFFRDNAAFQSLQSHVIPHLFDRKESNEPIRVWVPGCATGEEAYSLAILLLEEAAKHQSQSQIQLFGSDLDAQALATAREGCYPAAIEADISEDRLRRFFTREGDHYRVRRELRDMALFAAHNVLRDPPFSRIDFVSCRNLLIYLDRDLQQQACSTFYYALNPGGFLFLGASESADNPPGLFRSIDRKFRIYQSMANAGDKPRLLPRLLGSMRAHDSDIRPERAAGAGTSPSAAALHRQAIEKLSVPSILIDRMHRVMHLSENSGRYLQLSGGPLSSDAIDLARPEFRFDLRSALNRVFQHGQSTVSPPILVHFDGAPHRVHFLVRPVGDGDASKPGNAVVLFFEGEAVDEPSVAVDGRSSTDDTVRRLREELQLTQARLRTTRDESEAANEELRAANEELQSINEEYRSTSEELETSKEELQSINEELQTLNSELKLKLDAVSRAHSDLQNLMTATEVGTLFLDSGLRIKRFTEPVRVLFRITPNDEGRPLTDFAHLLLYEDLIKDADDVLANLVRLKREIHSREDRWYDVRLRPYRTVDDKIDGVVITFMDVTERRQVVEALRTSEQRLRQVSRLVELSRDSIFIWDIDGGILEWNRGSEEIYGYSREEALGRKREDLLGTGVPGVLFADVLSSLVENGSWNGELRHRTKDGRELTVESRVVLETLAGRRLALESTRDVTERKLWDDRQTLLLGELTHRVKNTLAVVQAIAQQSLRSGSTEGFLERFSGRLSALARTHNLLVQSRWTGADLATMAKNQLEPYTSDNPERLQLDGPAVSLSADAATPFGLVLHELATNAAKYGSLSDPAGTVELSWTTALRNNENAIKVIWREGGGPPVTVPSSTGLGSALIDGAIPGATVKREFRPEGVVCTIELPLTEPADNEAVG